MELETHGFVLIRFLCLGEVIPIKGLPGATTFSTMMLLEGTIRASSISRTLIKINSSLLWILNK